jgi:Icc-related predicted phosphoesterase
MSMRRALVWVAIACTVLAAQTPVLLIDTGIKAPFTFLSFGDTRFTNPADHKAANPQARQLLVKAMADQHPAFISIGGDIAYNGNDLNDWKVFDEETAVWRAQKIPVYPILGNHDLHGKEAVALANYFQRFPELRNARFYSVRAANALLLNLDSSLDELSGPQGAWIKEQLDNLAPEVEFVFLVLHHPPYTSSSDDQKFGGGHSIREAEKQLARMLEARQTLTRARFVVLSSHVHNYERHEHGGVVYFVTGGGGAHAYPIERAPEDLFQSKRVNYHYLQIHVEKREAMITMRRLGLETPTPLWTTEDTVHIKVPGNK